MARDIDLEYYDIQLLVLSNVANIRYWVDNNEDNISEEEIKQYCVLPMLQSLGWNIWDMQDVRYEYPLHNFRFDIALMNDNIPICVIEVKKYIKYSEYNNEISKTLEKGINQLKEYLKQSNIHIGILTDGITWIVINRDSNKILPLLDFYTKDKDLDKFECISRKALLNSNSDSYSNILDEMYGTGE